MAKAKRIDLNALKLGKGKKGAAAPAIAPMPMPSNKAMKSEKDYQAQDDAHTLARAAAVHADPARRKAAHAAALKLAQEKETEAHNLKSIIKKGVH